MSEEANKEAIIIEPTVKTPTEGGHEASISSTNETPLNSAPNLNNVSYSAPGHRLLRLKGYFLTNKKAIIIPMAILFSIATLTLAIGALSGKSDDSSTDTPLVSNQRGNTTADSSTAANEGSDTPASAQQDETTDTPPLNPGDDEAIAPSTGDTSTTTPPSPPPPASWSKPGWLVAGMSWQWQLDGTINTSFNVDVYDIDYETSSSVVNTLHNKGKKVICYVAVGSAENYRPDYDSFPSSVLGKSNGWPGEKWLDIRQISILQPIMEARFDICKTKGFDAIEPDLMDGYSNNTGFPLSYQDQIDYNTMIANIAHARGLAVGLKNDVEQASELEPQFDFSVNEQCAQYSECSTLRVFTDANKPVFHAEYSVSISTMCTASSNYNLSSIKKNLDLDAPILGTCN